VTNLRRLFGELRLPEPFIASSYFLGHYSFALISGLIKASKSNLLCVQRRKTVALQLCAFEDIQSDFIKHGLCSPYF
jgi:hypothetical protein